MNENTNAMPPEEQAENDRDARAEELESTFSYDGWKDHNLPQHVGSIRLANPLSLSVQPRGKTGSCAELYG